MLDARKCANILFYFVLFVNVLLQSCNGIYWPYLSQCLPEVLVVQIYCHEVIHILLDRSAGIHDDFVSSFELSFDSSSIILVTWTTSVKTRSFVLTLFVLVVEPGLSLTQKTFFVTRFHLIILALPDSGTPLKCFRQWSGCRMIERARVLAQYIMTPTRISNAQKSSNLYLALEEVLFIAFEVGSLKLLLIIVSTIFFTSLMYA